jgi:enoyl-CoA hydratase/3-hydroxyacyl-CoA dehydrogenase
MRDAIDGLLKKEKKKETTGISIAQVKEETKSKQEYSTIILEKYPFKVAKIILNRPKNNTITGELLDELENAIRSLWNDPEVNVIVIAGSGERFSAGAELSQYFPSSFSFLEFSRKGERVFRLLSEIPKITIASIKGVALGGGFELAISCDLRVSSPDAQLGFPEVTLGLIPAWGGSNRLAKLIGISRAMDLIITGRRINGKDAYEWGIVNRLSDNPDEESMNLAKSIAENSAPISAALAKRIINKGTEVPMDVGLEMESIAAGLVFSTEDLKEGISSFLQKKKPEYKGR